MPHIVVLGTLDTKLPEILYLHSRLKALAPETKITLIDCGRSPVNHEAITITQSNLISRYGPKDGVKPLKTLPRGDVVKFMIECSTTCVAALHKEQYIHGIIAAGGSGGTSLASAVMREALPIGVPKLIVSTIASGDTGPIVGETDVTMMYSVVDIAGTNDLLRNILNNAAGAIVGMSSAHERFSQESKDSTPDTQKIRIGITMFGVTTPCVDKIRTHLSSHQNIETYVFHATGHGGKAMERLISTNRLDAVIDLTTTEICDSLIGGTMSAGPSRLESALKAGIPNVISLGATDMVNFGPKNSIPERFREGRKFFEHNPSVTLMRTTKEECKSIAEFMVEKIKKFATRKDMILIRVPKGGVSMISTPGAVFEDKQADKELIETLKLGLKDTGICILEDERDINDDGFAVDIANDLIRLTELKRKVP